MLPYGLDYILILRFPPFPPNLGVLIVVEPSTFVAWLLIVPVGVPAVKGAY